MLQNCSAISCENGFNLQKEGHVLMNGCTITDCTVCGVRLDATPVSFTDNTMKNNWVAVMAYGNVSFDIADNLFEDSRCCALYLRDIAFSRFSGNTFTGSAKTNVEINGTLSGSVWVKNTLDLPMDESKASDSFGLTD